MAVSAEGFPRSARILKTSEFAEVKRRGAKVRVGALTLACLPEGSGRLGVIVSRRVGNAVSRNRLKRVVRDYFRRRRSEFPRGDCVIIFSPGTAVLGNVEIRDDLATALERIGRKIS